MISKATEFTVIRKKSLFFSLQKQQWLLAVKIYSQLYIHKGHIRVIWKKEPRKRIDKAGPNQTSG